MAERVIDAAVVASFIFFIVVLTGCAGDRLSQCRNPKGCVQQAIK